MLVVLLPVLEQIVAGQVGAVADRGEGREPECSVSRQLDHRQAQGAALRQEAQVARGRHRWCEGRVEAHLGDRVQDPEAVRPDQPHARFPADRDQLLLPVDAGGAGLPEPRRDHDQRRNALRSTASGDLGDLLGGNRDHRQVQRARHLLDLGIGSNRLDHVGARVDRMDDPAEAGREQVVEDLAADGAAPSRGSDHGDGAGLEKPGHRGCRRDPVPPLEALDGLRRKRGRKLDVDRAALRRELDREAALPEDLDHAVVLGQHLRLEDRDLRIGGRLGQVGEQDRPQPATLHLVRDRECRLRAIGAGAHVDGMGHRLGFRARGGQQAEPVPVVDIERPGDGVGGAGRGREEPKRPRLTREVIEELAQPPLIVAAHRANRERGAVAKHDIRLAVRWICQAELSEARSAPLGVTQTGQGAVLMTSAETPPSRVRRSGP